VDVVTFYNAKKGKEASQKMFGYHYNGGNDTLSIFNLIPDKPTAKVGTVAYKYARAISVPATVNPKK
jgi:hypothetical protein